MLISGVGAITSGRVNIKTLDFVYEGAHIFNLFALLVLHSMMVEKENKL